MPRGGLAAPRSPGRRRPLLTLGHPLGGQDSPSWAAAPMRAYLPGSAQICRDDRGAVGGMAAPFSSPTRYVTPPRWALGPATPTLEETPTSTHTQVMWSAVAPTATEAWKPPGGYPAQEALKDLGHTHIRDNSVATAGACIPRAEEGSRQVCAGRPAEPSVDQQQ